jgi:predicted RNase H-like HicB family nuclease
MNPQEYEVDIVPLRDDDGGGCAALVPELPGCRSDGDTPQEVLANAYDAVRCWTEAAEEVRSPVPSPRRIVA